MPRGHQPKSPALTKQLSHRGDTQGHASWTSTEIARPDETIKPQGGTLKGMPHGHQPKSTALTKQLSHRGDTQGYASRTSTEIDRPDETIKPQGGHSRACLTDINRNRPALTKSHWWDTQGQCLTGHQPKSPTVTKSHWGDTQGHASWIPTEISHPDATYPTFKTANTSWL